jgi:hypothetical protein
VGNYLGVNYDTTTGLTQRRRKIKVVAGAKEKGKTNPLTLAL